MISKIKGRVWKFGDNVDTDVMTSGKYINLPMDELKRHAFEEVRPEFAQKASPGDMIVSLADRKVINHTTGKVLDFQAFPDEMLRVLECGGIEPLLKQMKND